ncbi:hypothetical protein MGSAQ_002744, partial [marine sediment metagenome]
QTRYVRKSHMKTNQPNADQIKAQAKYQVIAIIDTRDKGNH